MNQEPITVCTSVREDGRLFVRFRGRRKRQGLPESEAYCEVSVPLDRPDNYIRDLREGIDVFEKGLAS